MTSKAFVPLFSDLLAHAGPTQLDWPSLASLFRVMSASDVLNLQEMKRHQNATTRWLTKDETPVALLFVSHRWETLDHPDPSGRQLRALQELLRRICACVEAMLVSRQERLRLVPSLTREGVLQAEEIGRRLLGYGPFSDGVSFVETSRELVREAFERFRDDRAAFRPWLAKRIGVWLDYTCMPQKPLATDELAEFQRAMLGLGSLVMSCTVVTLRYDRDEYPTRGWCAAEYFLGSGRSFAKGVFVDVPRLERGEEVQLPPPPVTGAERSDPVARVKLDAYEQDRSAFVDACEAWTLAEHPLIEVGPPDPWARYRDLQGSGFFALDQDPNPFRRVLETIRDLETALIEKWFLSETECTVDLGREVKDLLERFGLRCTDPADVLYLGFLLAAHGWIDALRPLFGDCLRRTLPDRSSATATDPGSMPILAITLKPLADEDRALFFRVKPHTPRVWHSHLSTLPGGDARVEAAISQVRRALEQRPPGFIILESDADLHGVRFERLRHE